jgi:hypothetical protein
MDIDDLMKQLKGLGMQVEEVPPDERRHLRKRDKSNMLGGSKLNAAIQAERLHDHWRDLSTKHDFKPGDLAMIKAGLGGQWSVPEYGQPVVITRAFPPVRDENAEGGQPGFLREYDVTIMLLTADGEIIEFAFDSRYLEPFTEK